MNLKFARQYKQIHSLVWFKIFYFICWFKKKDHFCVPKDLNLYLFGILLQSMECKCESCSCHNYLWQLEG